MGDAADLKALFRVAVAGGQPLRQGLSDRAFRPKIVAPDIAALRRAGPDAAVFVRPLKLKQGTLRGFVLHSQETLDLGSRSGALDFESL